MLVRKAEERSHCTQHIPPQKTAPRSLKLKKRQPDFYVCYDLVINRASLCTVNQLLLLDFRYQKVNTKLPLFFTLFDLVINQIRELLKPFSN